MNASPILTPQRSRASSSVFASATVRLIGFSHNTCFPASAALIDHGTCKWFGNGLQIASISPSAKSSSYDPYVFSIPSFAAASSAFFKFLDAIAAISLHSPFCIPGITFLVAIDAAPSTPHFTLPCFTARPPSAHSPLLSRRATPSNSASRFRSTLLARVRNKQARNLLPSEQSSSTHPTIDPP